MFVVVLGIVCLFVFRSFVSTSLLLSFSCLFCFITLRTWFALFKVFICVLAVCFHFA